MTKLPKYAELPRFDDIGANHSWEVFGPDDELGTLNLLDAAAVRDAAGLVRTGERIGLTLPLDQPDPPLFGRQPFRHSMRNSGAVWDDWLDSFYPQASTQWDGFRHYLIRRYGFYGGVKDEPGTGNPRLSIHHWARGGIVGRGVLLDVVPHLGERNPLETHSITAEDLRAVVKAQNTEIRPGDILCVRTGWMSAYQALDQDARAALEADGAGMSVTGLAADEGMAELLWDWHIAAVAVDNPGVEVMPGDRAVGSLHRRLLVLLGIPLGELFDFDALAERLHEDGRSDFLFLSVPLNIVGGLGSPGNAVAVL